jgi:predicted Zn-dependent protease
MHRLPLGLLAAAVFIALSITAHAQATSVKAYIQQVAAGWTSDAKKALPDLLIDSPDDPGVLFLHASLVDDPKKASPLLERIVDAYPKSEWADDALARLVIVAATKNEADKAKKAFAQMREQYSQSELLPVVYDVMRSTVGAPPPGDRTAAAPAVAAKKPEAEPGPKAAASYTLVTRTTYNKKEADDLLALFKAKRMRAKVTTDVVKGKTRYTVSVGEYITEPDALKDIEAVRSVCKCKPAVAKR